MSFPVGWPYPPSPISGKYNYNNGVLASTYGDIPEQAGVLITTAQHDPDYWEIRGSAPDRVLIASSSAPNGFTVVRFSTCTATIVEQNAANILTFPKFNGDDFVPFTIQIPPDILTRDPRLTASYPNYGPGGPTSIPPGTWEYSLIWVTRQGTPTGLGSFTHQGTFTVSVYLYGTYQQTVPEAVTDLTGDLDICGFTVSLSWAAPIGAASYRLLRDGVEIASGVTDTDYTDGLTMTQARGSLTYTVFAVNNDGESSGVDVTVTSPWISLSCDAAAFSDVSCSSPVFTNA